MGSFSFVTIRCEMKTTMGNTIGLGTAEITDVAYGLTSLSSTSIISLLILYCRAVQRILHQLVTYVFAFEFPSQQ